MWKFWRRRPRFATGGHVGPGCYLVGDVNADPCVLPPAAAIAPPDPPPTRAPEIHVHIEGSVVDEGELLAAMNRAMRRGRGL